MKSTIAAIAITLALAVTAVAVTIHYNGLREDKVAYFALTTIHNDTQQCRVDRAVPSYCYENDLISVGCKERVEAACETDRITNNSRHEFCRIDEEVLDDCASSEAQQLRKWAIK